MHEPKALYPNGGPLILIKDTNPIIYLGVPRPIVQDVKHRVTPGIQCPLREGAKRADADVGAELLDDLAESQFDVGLNDFPNPREKGAAALT